MEDIRKKRSKFIARFTNKNKKEIIDVKYKSIDDISIEMSVKRRNNVYKALKDGLIVKYNNNLEIVKSLVLKTFLRQKKKINQIFI